MFVTYTIQHQNKLQHKVCTTRVCWGAGRACAGGSCLQACVPAANRGLLLQKVSNCGYGTAVEKRPPHVAVAAKAFIKARSKNRRSACKAQPPLK
jgi:hypothetical protein